MSVAQLLKWAEKPNIMDSISEDMLTKIGEDVVTRANDDDSSRSDWKKRSKDAMDLALQVLDEKTFPWPNASNVKYPIVTVAAMQFHARIMPVILNGNKIAKAKVTGEDPEGAKEEQAVRVAEYMNYQLIEEMEDWEDDMDRLMLALPIEGCQFKKTYYSPALGTNVSEWIRPEDFIVHYKTKKLATCNRKTHRFYLHPQDIQERMGDIWDDVDLNISQTDKDNEERQEFYEQHCLLDLDEDGYKEPYCVTVHVQSRKVVRVKANYYAENIYVKGYGGEIITADQTFDGERSKIQRITAAEYFTKYSFIPAPDGGFYDIGIGHIVGPLNHSISTILNEIIDAGTLANVSGGFVIDGVSVSGQRGQVKQSMGEFKKIKTPRNMPIRDAVMQFQFGGPSAVLFNVLGMLIQSAKDITGVQDIHTGGTEHKETATTTMARIEEGQKVFNATFKRVYRSLTQELKKLHKLNSIYLKPEVYFQVLDSDEQGVVTLADFRNDGTDVQPIGDPSMANTAQRIAKIEALLALRGDPNINQKDLMRRYVEAIDVPNPEALTEQEALPPQVMQEIEDMKQAMEQMQAELQDAQAAANDEQRKSVESQSKAEFEAAKIEIDRFNSETTRMKADADATIKSREQTLKEMQAEFDMQSENDKAEVSKFKAEVDAFNAETNRMKAEMDAEIGSREKHTDAMGIIEDLFSKLEADEEEKEDPMEKLTAAMTKPRKIVRNAEGDIEGVE